MTDAYQPSPLGGVAYTPGTQVTPATLPAGQPTPAPAPYKPSPLDYTAHLESGDRNIPQQIHDINTERGTPAQGNWQFIVPTWQRRGAQAGIDLQKYPTPMSAPRSVQAQVAAVTPGAEFGPRTQAGLRAMYPGIDLHKPLGYYGGTAGGYQPGSSTAAGSPLPVASTPADASVGAALAALNGPGSNVDLKPALNDLNRIANPDQTQMARPDGSGLQLQQAANAGGNARSAQIAMQASQLAAMLRQQGAQPLIWSSQPFGSTAGQQRTPTTMTSAGGQMVVTPGTTLNSTSYGYV